MEFLRSCSDTFDVIITDASDPVVGCGGAEGGDAPKDGKCGGAEGGTRPRTVGVAEGGAGGGTRPKTVGVGVRRGGTRPRTVSVEKGGGGLGAVNPLPPSVASHVVIFQTMLFIREQTIYVGGKGSSVVVVVLSLVVMVTHHYAQP